MRRYLAKTVRHCVALIMLGIFAGSAAIAADPAHQIKMLVYNTHGLPGLIAGDKPEQRFPEIAARTEGYDLVLLQEDFAHHELLTAHLPDTDATVVRGSKADQPPCFFQSGSGLTFVSRLSAQGWAVSSWFEAFDTCSGWLGGANDCFAQKGFQLISLEQAGAARIVVVNTHLDAGPSEKDRLARAIQLDQIATALEQQAAGQAVMIAGDFNLDWDSPDDRVLLTLFQKRLGLMRAEQGTAVQNGWQILDYILYRSGAKTALAVVDAGEDQALKLGDAPLSDHPALFATFAVR